MLFPQMLGYLGGIIAGAAYIPQVSHLIREKCTAGISIKAFTMWMVAALLLLISAVAIDAKVFIFLAFVQLISSLTIIFFTQKYTGQYCPTHLSVK